MNLKLLAGMVGAGLLAACVSLAAPNRDPERPLPTVAAVDLDRYLGDWVEAARLPNAFERDCVGATATYTKRADGLIGVRNVCTKADGSTEDAVGRAKIVDPATNARLKVSFFGPFFGDYWIVDLAPDYSWAIVGEPRGRFLWVLTRAPLTDSTLKADLTARIAALGYDTRPLIWNAPT